MRQTFARVGRWLLDASRLPAALAAWMGLVTWRWRKPLLAAVVVCAAVWLGINLWIIVGTRSYRYEHVAFVPQRQTAIVLGALVYPSGRPSDILADRLDTAADLYLAGRVGKVLVSGDQGRAAYDEVNAMRRRLQDRGVRPEDIFMDHAGFDTCDTMQRARRVFGVNSAVIVTQAFHLPRAVYLARPCGLDAVGGEAGCRRYRHAARNHIRESLARVKSFAEIQLGVDPHHLGPRIPIDGDGRATWALAARSGGNRGS